MAVLPVAGLDFRFGWGPAAPGWAVGLGYVLFVAGFAGQVWPQAVNRHFEPSVRIQTDRGQTVIDTGPYAIIRHPGYVSGTLLAFGMALCLGSFWALLPALLVKLALVGRTLLEEKTLSAELPGYADYKTRVKIPLGAGRLVTARSDRARNSDRRSDRRRFRARRRGAAGPG